MQIPLTDEPSADAAVEVDRDRIKFNAEIDVIETVAAIDDIENGQLVLSTSTIPSPKLEEENVNKEPHLGL